jgi:hypothetical protein
MAKWASCSVGVPLYIPLSEPGRPLLPECGTARKLGSQAGGVPMGWAELAPSVSASGAEKSKDCARW